MDVQENDNHVSLEGREKTCLNVLDVSQDGPGEEKTDDRHQLTYGVTDIPPMHITLIYAVQILLTMVSGPMTVVYLLHSIVCPEGYMLVYAQMLSTAIFVCGLCTLIQCTFGIRLPVFQGSATTFVVPIAAVAASQNWADTSSIQTTDALGNVSSNATVSAADMCASRIQVVSGSLIAASAIQLIIGITGIMGFLMTYIGPLTIAPCVTLIGLSLVKVVLVPVKQQWGIAFLTMALLLFFCLFLGKFKVPLPGYNRVKGWTTNRYPIFRIFPQLLAMVIAWILCYILTATNVFPPDPTHLSYRARTDAKVDALYRATWIFFPYPGRYGWPKFDVGMFAGMIGATISSIIESFGDYYATAAACQLPPPPKHAVNRGIAMEGLGSIISGLVGASHATTTYSTFVGYISLTGVGSRFVYQMSSLVAIIAGLFGKLGGFLALVPDPVLGGMNTVGLGMVATVGLSNLRHIDLKSSRNHMVLGLSLMLGLMLPKFVLENPGAINTGSAVFDQILTVFLSTEMFIGGSLGFILDNLVPGTASERGLANFREDSQAIDMADSKDNTYNIPFTSTNLKQYRAFSYIPCLPCYTDRNIKICRTKHKLNIADEQNTGESFL